MIPSSTETQPPPPSVRKPVPSLPSPFLVHSLGDENKSVLSLMADTCYIYVGGQGKDITVWTKDSYTLKTNLRGHTGSILALELVEEKRWLFSASGDSTVRIWCTATLSPIYVLHPWLETGAGDLFSLAWNPWLEVVYVGCQNTSLQWFEFSEDQMGQRIQEICSGVSTPTRKVHKFFDSYPQYTHKPADSFANNFGVFSDLEEERDPSNSTSTLNIPAENVIDSAHYGYVYCMAMVPSNRIGSNNSQLSSNENHRLLTGSGDETIKLWSCLSTGPELIHTFECSHGAVLSLATRGDTMFAGCQDGYVKVFDLENKILVRTIIVQENIDILSLSIMHSDLYTCSANGQVQRWSPSFNCISSWKAHPGIVLSSVITQSTGTNGFVLVTGANDGFVKIWDIMVPLQTPDEDRTPEADISDLSGSDDHDIMTYALSIFVSIASISSEPLHREDCRQAAIWLKKCLHQLGAESSLLPTSELGNPLVLATFHGTQGQRPKPRILFYGHYDVIAAPRDGWNSDPFKVFGCNGYLYGRGVTDNKGPIIAIACAVAELLRRRALGVDVVFLIEGEEEVGSTGFMTAVRKHKEQIGHIDAILLSNSTWITEYPPCITYGLRGVVHAVVSVSSDSPDQHSGVEGGAVVEPMLDMIRLLSTLMDSRRKVAIPGFYENVRQQTECEKQLYELLSHVTGNPGSLLSSRWREPSLTVHHISVSGPGNSTVIPGKVTAQVSLRIVPDQDLETISQCLITHLHTSFNAFQSPNKLSVSVDHRADWWLGDLNDPWFTALETAVYDEWGVQPLRIREGGSIPSIPNLEKEFGCRALHLPLGQSTDRAHLPNERISLTNLRRGKSVVERFLTKIATGHYTKQDTP